MTSLKEKFLLRQGSLCLRERKGGQESVRGGMGEGERHLALAKQGEEERVRE